VRRQLSTGGREASCLALEKQDKAFSERAFLGGGETVGAHVTTLDVAPCQASEKDATPWVDIREESVQWNAWPRLLCAWSASAT
jgi:hypothetical protein